MATIGLRTLWGANSHSTEWREFAALNDLKTELGVRGVTSVRRGFEQYGYDAPWQTEGDPKTPEALSEEDFTWLTLESKTVGRFIYFTVR